MRIKHITEEDRHVWNDFVSRSTNSPILQSWEWGELKSAFGWQPIRIAIETSGGTIIAGISILKRKIPFLGCMFYAPRGPILDFKNDRVFNLLLVAVALEARKHKAIFIKIDPDVEEDESGIISALEKRGFIRKKKQIQPRSTFYLDLSSDLDDIMKSFEEKTRYNIRLSEKKGVSVKEISNVEGMKLFYDLYIETAQRDIFLIHPYSYYEKIQKLMVEKGFGKVFIAYYKDEPIAGVVIFTFGKRLWYMYGASKNEHRNVMPNHALHWAVIKWAKENGYQLYDLWGIPSNPSENHPLFGVYRFKKGFNGKLVKLIGVYDLPFNKAIYDFIDRGIAFWQNLRSLIKKGKIEDSLEE